MEKIDIPQTEQTVETETPNPPQLSAPKRLFRSFLEFVAVVMGIIVAILIAMWIFSDTPMDDAFYTVFGVSAFIEFMVIGKLRGWKNNTHDILTDSFYSNIPGNMYYYNKDR